MHPWVALLRGVNVGGVKIHSADLADCLSSLGLTEVRTVLASGNAVFAAEAGRDAPEGSTTDALALKARVEAGLSERFGYRAWVVLTAADQLAIVASAYPFARRDESHHPYVVFTSDASVLAELAARAHELASHDTEKVEVAGDVVYWECPKGSSTDTPFAKVLASERYQPTTTTRTLRTVEKILTAAGR